MFAFKLLIFCTTILFQVHQVHLLNILGIFPYQGKSHFIAHEALLKDLARRGHNVTVVSYFPQKIPIENYHDISLKSEENSYENYMAIDNPSYFKIIYRSMYLAFLGNGNCKALLSDGNVQNLWNNNRKFDVVVIEQFISDCALGITHELKAPVVGVTAHSLMPFHYNRFGVPQHPAFTPCQVLNGGKKTSLIQRIERLIFTVYYHYIVRILSQRMDQYIISQYLKNIPPLEELGKEIKFLLLYEHFVLFSPYILPTNVIPVGGFHVAKVKPLPMVSNYLSNYDNSVSLKYSTILFLFQGTFKIYRRIQIWGYLYKFWNNIKMYVYCTRKIRCYNRSHSKTSSKSYLEMGLRLSANQIEECLYIKMAASK
ncbi:UDP-glucosyltransferase 2-like [Bicyclus anynana]|uniref:UDP-glucosyltransferase 2-like n=1 Tax=Bicyclus anynana TaxID=110368 RepID=A0ABM3LSM9_BICAN|nr:UDP-glucosyltransferase 2-like [Bicyclus anynana]